MTHREPTDAQPTRPTTTRRRLGAALAAAALLATPAFSPTLLAVPAQAAGTSATAPAATKAQDLVLQNGSTDSQRLLSWQTDDPAELGVRWAKKADLVDGRLPESAQTAQQTEQGEAVDGRHFHRATMDGLDADAQYSYQVGSDEAGWSDVHSFGTSVTGDFNVYGDPQIGSSGDVDSDATGWKRTLQASLRTNPEASFLYTLGDQVEHKDNQEEFAAYLAPEQSRTLPQATTLGNHEAGSKAYSDHFNRPNVSADHGQNVKGTGGDYWFISNDVLFVNFNANASSEDDIAEHKDFLDKVVKQQGDKARWTAVVFHKAPYSTANHLDDDDVMRFRAAFPAAFSANDVDLVLGGHDHVYSRTHLLNGSGSPADEAADGESIVDKRPDASAPVELDKDSGESLYYTLTSSSGSKFYDMYTDEQMDEAGFPRDNIAAAEQTRTPGYLNVKATCEALTLTSRSVDAAGADSVVETVKLAKDAGDCQGGEPSEEPTAEPSEVPSTEPSTAPAETPSAQPGQTSTPEQPTGEPGAGAGGGDANGGAGTDPGAGGAPGAGSLPRTGVQIGTALGIAGLLVAGGGLALVLARKRRG
ncbi:metallophosphoesterase [Brevibacterium moorei]|uniref:metallophosphoesterase n=1 Tax=Brevibacterium moorei TaxID=2968457 RepID=UPI00211BCC46|nr:fibronectin type III domain-containing protein [Brevibacterium sp. 68QC2CO]